MVRYWCNACGREHDNARDCPMHVSMKDNERIGKKTKKIKDDMNRRANLKQNDASKKGGWDCFPVLVGLLSIPTALIWGTVEALHHLL